MDGLDTESPVSSTTVTLLFQTLRDRPAPHFPELPLASEYDEHRNSQIAIGITRVFVE